MRKRLAIPSEIDPERERCSVGDVLWRRTSTLRTRSPIKGVSGRCTPHGRVYYERGDVTVFRPMKVPHDPKTEAQVVQRQRWGRAVGNWQHLTMQVRRDWQEYALRYFFRLQYVMNNAGLNTYAKVQMLRQAMGLELSQTAPQAPCPPAIIRVEQAASASPTTYSFRLEHRLTDVSGVRVLVELTPAMAHQGRRPREQELRWACGCSAESLVPLAESGATVTVTGARFGVAEGQRYGVRVRLVSHEGVPGPALMTDFIRLGEHEPDPPPPPRNSRSAKRQPKPALPELSMQELFDRYGSGRVQERPTRMLARVPAEVAWGSTCLAPGDATAGRPPDSRNLRLPAQIGWISLFSHGHAARVLEDWCGLSGKRLRQNRGDPLWQ